MGMCVCACVCACACICVFTWQCLGNGSLLSNHKAVSNSFVIPWAVAHQTPLSMGFPRHEYWSGLPFPSPGDLPDPGMEPWSPALQADSLPTEPLGKP